MYIIYPNKNVFNQSVLNIFRNYTWFNIEQTSVQVFPL